MHALPIQLLTVFLLTVSPHPGSAMGPTKEPPPPRPESTFASGLIHGRVTDVDGTVYQGRIRFGGDEEASWSDYFNGVRDRNEWAELVSDDLLRVEQPIELFGFTLGTRTRRLNLDRPFMVRFGDIRRIDARLRHIDVTLKSGTVVILDRFSADDFADGVRVWDADRGVVDLGEWQIRSIEFMPAPAGSSAARRLRGTAVTAVGRFSGNLQWNREQGLADDLLFGIDGDQEKSLRFDAIRSIVPTQEGARVWLSKGGEVSASGPCAWATCHRGVYVDDERFGRVLVPWAMLERLELDPAGPSPAYSAFLAGTSLSGMVESRDGRRLSGRLVFDLDESESTETLDAPAAGIDYSIPFGMLASIAVPTDSNAPVRLGLRNSSSLMLERQGDLGDLNAGLLVFPAGSRSPEYLPWSDVRQILFDQDEQATP